MLLSEKIAFVVATNNREILASNLLASPCFRGSHDHQLIVQQGRTSAAEAYNDGIQQALNDLVIFVHQDVFLPEGWMSQLSAALKSLSQTDPNWGVLGCWGAEKNGKYHGHIYSSGWGVLGSPFETPEHVQTLDEIVLILRKSSGLRFDPELPHFHFYGTDICMRAAQRGMKSYALSAFCVHNTTQLLSLPKDFYRCYFHIRRAWWTALPIQTTCIRISKHNSEVYKRMAKEIFLHRMRANVSPARRVVDPTAILKGLKAV